MNDAERWLDEHGWDDGQTFQKEDGTWLYRELDEESDAKRHHPILVQADESEFEPPSAWRFPDGSGIVFSEYWWDAYDANGVSSGGESVYTLKEE